MSNLFKNCKVFQINLHHSKAAEAELLLRDDEFDIALVQEPLLRWSNNALLFSNSINKKTIGKDGSRACIRFDKALPAWEVPQFMGEDISTVLVQHSIQVGSGYREKSKIINVYYCSLYCDITLDIRQNQEFMSFLQFVKAGNHPCVIGCDSNAHSTLWGSPDSNPRGDIMEEIIESFNLQVCNKGEVPTFNSSRGSTHIDVTLVNESFQRWMDIKDWTVDVERPSFSDHYYISFNSATFQPVSEYYRSFLRVDWSKFVTEIVTRFDSLPDPLIVDLEEATNAWNSLLQDVMDKVIPLRPAVRNRPIPWWNPGLDDLRSHISKVYAKVRRNKGGQRLKDAYAKKCKDYRSLLLKSKKEAWRDFCSRYDSTFDVANIVRACQPRTQVQLGLLKDPLGNVVQDPKEALDILMSTHFPESISDPDSGPTSGLGSEIGCVDDDDFNGIITLEKLKESISSFHSYKAAGPDGIAPCVLQRLPTEMIEYLRVLMVRSVRENFIPTLWRQMRVVFIPKPGKSYDNAKAYRPITLSSFVLKTLERLFQWHLQEKIPSLCFQHAYTRGRSTDSALEEAVTFIEDGIYSKQFVLAVSLDCSGAFDNISFDGALRALWEEGIDDDIASWYDNILRHRSVSATVKGVSKTVRPTRGSPQGGVLSPIIWNLTIHSLLRQYQANSAKVVGYADDVLLLLKGDNPEVLAHQMTEELNRILDWGKERNLSFNPTKTVATMFTRKRPKQFPPWPDLFMDGEKLEYSDQVKYLGVNLDHKLSSTPHVKIKVAKAKKALNMIKGVIGQSWGLRPQQAMWAYTSVIRPAVTYGALVWAHNLKKCDIRTLDKVQRLGLLGLCHPMRSTPTRGLEAIFGLFPLYLECQRTATMARLRIKPQGDLDDWGFIKQITKPHGVSHDLIIRELFTEHLDKDEVTRQHVWGRTFGSDEIEQSLTIYTDGSKTDDGTGAGFCIASGRKLLGEFSIHLSPDNTVFQAEVMAIKEALSWVKDHLDVVPPSGVHIWTDSKSSIGALRRILCNSALVIETKKLLLSLTDSIRVSIGWVRGHSGVEGNEIADLLAKVGADSDDLELQPVGVPRATLKSKVKDYYMGLWQTMWDAMDSCRQTKLMMPKVKVLNSRDSIFSYSRQKLNQLCQFVTGHCLLGRHMDLIHKRDHDGCKFCKEGDETPHHFLVDCPKYQLHRQTLLQDEDLEDGLPLTTLAKFLSVTGIGEMLSHTQ